MLIATVILLCEIDRASSDLLSLYTSPQKHASNTRIFIYTVKWEKRDGSSVIAGKCVFGIILSYSLDSIQSLQNKSIHKRSSLKSYKAPWWKDTSIHWTLWSWQEQEQESNTRNLLRWRYIGPKRRGRQYAENPRWCMLTHRKKVVHRVQILPWKKPTRDAMIHFERLGLDYVRKACNTLLGSFVHQFYYAWPGPFLWWNENTKSPNTGHVRLRHKKALLLHWVCGKDLSVFIRLLYRPPESLRTTESARERARMVSVPEGTGALRWTSNVKGVRKHTRTGTNYVRRPKTCQRLLRNLTVRFVNKEQERRQKRMLGRYF